MSMDDHDQVQDHYLGERLLVVGQETEPTKKGKKKRDTSVLRKAPNAPKRFKSSYICFFMAKQPVIKAELGEKSTVTAISKRSAEMWKSLPADERAHWDGVAAKDKQRYMVEKSQYTGPWQVPWKRVRKDPSAPKRPMSAFLYFSQGRRTQIKDDNPDVKNTEVSRILGEMWRNLSEEGRFPHVEREKKERDQYKIAIAAWREENDAKQEAERKLLLENAESAAAVPETQPQFFPESYATQPAAPYATQPAAMANPYIFQNYQSQFTPQTGPGPYQFPTNGKQPVILGPSGTPYMQQQPPPMQGAPPTFDDGTNLMAPPNALFDYSADQAGGDPTV